MSTFLDRILTSRRNAVDGVRARLDELEAIARDAEPSRGFRAALAADGMSVIAEIKRRSPSKGDLFPDLDPAVLAKEYERGGARAVSVLTEPEFFGGSEADLVAARAACSLPVLWKDFVIDPAQVVQACAAGADAILVITRILSDDMLKTLIDEANRWDVCPLVEVFNDDDLQRSLDAGADVIGVNHRDLETFEEDPTATARLRALVPGDIVLIGESAISTRADVAALEAIAVDAILVGEALVRSGDPAAKIRELLGS